MAQDTRGRPTYETVYVGVEEQLIALVNAMPSTVVGATYKGSGPLAEVPDIAEAIRVLTRTTFDAILPS